MAQAHAHAHRHAHERGRPAGTAAAQHRRRLGLVLLITVAVLLAEVVGAVLSGSLGLLADAGHMGADAAGIALSLLAVGVAARPATPQRTFGYQRAEILAAVANAVVLFGVGGYVLVEAVRRLIVPPEVTSGLMVVFGLVALAGNTTSLALLARAQAASLTVRGAFLEVASDALGAVAVVFAAVVIELTGFQRADALASLLIGALIVPRTWRLLRDAVDVLLEATPRGVDMDAVRDHITCTPGVLDVHDLHVWMITSGVPVLSAHVVIDQQVLDDLGGGQVLDRLGECLAGHFDVDHCTFQLEPPGHAAHEHPTHS